MFEIHTFEITNTSVNRQQVKCQNISVADFDQLDHEINSLQKNLKPKVNHLRDLEHKDELKGFNLQPLSREELSNIMDMT